SPSRSGSVARKTSLAVLTALLSSLMTSPFPLIVRYLGTKSFSTSTPSVDLGKSRTWPTEAFTVYLAGRNFLIVRALVGDSTIIRGFFTGQVYPACQDGGKELLGSCIIFDFPLLCTQSATSSAVRLCFRPMLDEEEKWTIF